MIILAMMFNSNSPIFKFLEYIEIIWLNEFFRMVRIHSLSSVYLFKTLPKILLNIFDLTGSSKQFHNDLLIRIKVEVNRELL
jgi:hypothetical protein